MKNLYLLLLLLFTNCASKQQIEVVHEAEKEVVSSTGSPNEECEKCTATTVAGPEPDTAFNFSNGSKLLLCGYSESREGKKIYSEFVLSDCGNDSIIDFWSAVEEYEILFGQDTLQLHKVELLAIGNERELIREKWLTEYFYYDSGKLQRIKKLNPKIKYSQSQIDQSLKEYELTHWKTQIEGSEEYTEEKMELANRLLIAAVSGSEQAEQFFKEFDSKFKPDGAYAEWYHEMADMLKFSKEQKNKSR